MFIYFFPYLLFVEISATVKVKDKGLVPLVQNSVGIQFFIDVENHHEYIPCAVHSYPKKCCMTDTEPKDCGAMYVTDSRLESLAPKDTDSLIHVFPILVQHDLVGFCDFLLKYQCSKCRNSLIVKIPFDTRIFSEENAEDLIKDYISERKVKECDTVDDDTLNNCEPVNCDLKYSGERQFFNSELSKCIPAPICEGDPDKDLPDVAYVPSTNVCEDLENPLTVKDIYDIKAGLYITEAQPKQNLLKVELKSNCSTISQNLKLIRDLMNGRLCPDVGDMSDYSKCCKMAALKILACIVGLCAVLLSFICCMHSSLWMYQRWSDGTLQDCFQGFKLKIRKKKKPTCSPVYSNINANVRNTLLREVIVREIPIELRDSVVDICERMDKEVRWKKRYRRDEMGSQVSLKNARSSTSSMTSSDDSDEKEKLLK